MQQSSQQPSAFRLAVYCHQRRPGQSSAEDQLVCDVSELPERRVGKRVTSFKVMAFNENSHLAIRHAEGRIEEYLKKEAKVWGGGGGRG